MQETPDTAPSAPSGDLAPRAIDLAARWVAEAAEFPADASAQRLAGVLKDPNGLSFTIGFVDGVMRPESLTAAASTRRVNSSAAARSVVMIASVWPVP